MAKKKKSSKKKESSSSSTTNEEEIKRKQLIQNAKDLKERIENETKKEKEFETRINQLKFYWHLEKEELQNKSVEYERIEENQRHIKKSHENEIDSIKEQLKQSLHRNQNYLIKTKNECKVELYKVQEQHLIQQRKKEQNALECQNHLRNMQISHNNFLNQLRHDHDDSINQLREVFKVNFFQASTDAEQKMKEMKEDEEVKMKDELKVLEEKKEQQVKDTLCKHEEVRLHQSSYYYILHSHTQHPPLCIHTDFCFLHNA